MRVIAIDKDLNKIYSEGRGVYLALGSKRLRLGTFEEDKDGLMFQMVRLRAEHLFNKTQSYGFNEMLLSKLKELRISRVKLMDDKQSWMLSVKDIFDKGHYLHYKQQGFEKQIFMKLKDMEKYEIGKGRNISKG